MSDRRHRTKIQRALRLFSALPAIWLLCPALAGCPDEFEPVSSLTNEGQVLALSATFDESQPEPIVVLDALVHWPDETPAFVWIVCLPIVGDSIVDCFANHLPAQGDLPECRQSDGSRLCVAGFDPTASYTLPMEAFAGVEDPVFYVYLLLARGAGYLAECREALARGKPTANCLISMKRVFVPIPISGPANINPGISGLLVDGVPALPGQPFLLTPSTDDLEDLKIDLAAAMDPNTLDELDPGSVDPESVDYVLSWFVTCGEIGPDRVFLTCERSQTQPEPECRHKEVTFKPNTSGACMVHVVVRDIDDGTGFFSQEIQIQDP